MTMHALFNFLSLSALAFPQFDSAMKLRESAKGRIRCGELGENRLINRSRAAEAA